MKSGRWLVRFQASVGATNNIKPWRALSVSANSFASFGRLPSSNETCSSRWFSSSSKSRRGGGGFKLDALPFSISPEEALEKFRKWSVDDQGLNYLMSWDSVRIGAAYVPVWSFDLNMRYTVTDANGKKRYDWKPALFSSIYSSQQSVIHLPGLGAYAGYGFRRSLVHPIVNTTLVFMGDQTVPFEKYMLRDMQLAESGDRIEVYPDPWNATRNAAFTSLVEDLENIAADADGTVQLQTEIVSSRRVYIPIYFIDYTLLGGIQYRAFTSGCDKATGVSGVDHRVFGNYQPDQQAMNQASQNFLSGTWIAAQQVVQTGLRTNPRGLLAILAIALQFTAGIVGRILARIPALAFLGGLFVGFRKIIQPWYETRSSSAEWERQREYEKSAQEASHSYGTDFVDNGSAQRYFFRNRDKILQFLGGTETQHGPSDFDWYKDWEEWARKQWEQQQQQQQQQSTYSRQQQQQGYSQRQQQQQQGRRKTQQQTKKKEYVWDFDPNDPYSVLGIRRGATKSEVSAAFRKEMLKHHPDTQAGATEAEKLRAVERSKLITEAYRTIKTSMKR
ncbi:protein DnaJ [Seminavis robusta]|uniref:Protein DnaJ n=1 Tax=Seminavis robusta TaxID=568900 RepID=A0A9N8D9T2_9STRA|nr:protein DnaJ [Seminavis robusta]|eukprot:Sro50_g029260.1 protein DnaJ (561) ;mRNA; r:130100-132020